MPRSVGFRHCDLGGVCRWEGTLLLSRQSTPAQSSRRSRPISSVCPPNTRRRSRNNALASHHRQRPSASSSAAEPSGVLKGSCKRPRSFPLSSRGTDDKGTDEHPLSRLRKLTNVGPSDARSRPLPGRLPTSLCWTVHLTHPPPRIGRPERQSSGPLRKGAEKLLLAIYAAMEPAGAAHRTL